MRDTSNNTHWSFLGLFNDTVSTAQRHKGGQLWKI
jgi:hypothetical protein